jgi:hypothetical protein
MATETKEFFEQPCPMSSCDEAAVNNNKGGMRTVYVEVTNYIDQPQPYFGATCLLSGAQVSIDLTDATAASPNGAADFATLRHAEIKVEFDASGHIYGKRVIKWGEGPQEFNVENLKRAYALEQKYSSLYM